MFDLFGVFSPYLVDPVDIGLNIGNFCIGSDDGWCEGGAWSVSGLAKSDMMEGSL